jgi:hypothetical protein
VVFGSKRLFENSAKTTLQEKQGKNLKNNGEN